jgi:hypothetical protein
MSWTSECGVSIELAVWISSYIAPSIPGNFTLRHIVGKHHMQVEIRWRSAPVHAIMPPTSGGGSGLGNADDSPPVIASVPSRGIKGTAAVAGQERHRR